jgi:HlyD family secretion protein
MTSNVSTLAAKPHDFVLSRRHLVIAGIAVITIGAALFLYRQRAVEVELVAPKYEDIESTVSAKGNVIPTDDFAARATFSGIVDNIYVHLGQKVHAGQKLLQLRDQFADARVNNARAALLSAELNDENLRSNGSRDDQISQASDLEKARNEQAAAAKSLATIQQLRTAGSTSDAEVTAARQRLDTANALLEAAKQRSQGRYRPLDIKNAEAKIAADKANLAGERVSYRNANVVSPIEGTAYLLPINRYDFVQMGADLVHVADLKKLSVRASFYEPDIRQLKTGETVKITWPTGAPGRSWDGRIEAKPMAVTGDGVLRTGICTVDITSDTDGLPVNTSVTVTATVEKHSHVLTLPREALRDEGTRHFVYRLDGGRLEKTPVEIGLINAMKAEITKGLTDNDQVAVRAPGGETLRNNMHVKRQGAS